MPLPARRQHDPSFGNKRSVMGSRKGWLPDFAPRGAPRRRTATKSIQARSRAQSERLLEFPEAKTRISCQFLSPGVYADVIVGLPITRCEPWLGSARLFRTKKAESNSIFASSTFYPNCPASADAADASGRCAYALKRKLAAQRSASSYLG